MLTLQKAQTPTAMRQEYTDSLIAVMLNKVATDLVNGDTTREIGVASLANVYIAISPNDGAGNAERKRAIVDASVDDAIAAINVAQVMKDDKAA